MQIKEFLARLFSSKTEIKIEIRRDDSVWQIKLKEFEDFDFREGDKLKVLAPTLGQSLPVTWGDTNVPISRGVAIRVPEVYKFAEYMGFRIPNHLVTLTGAG